MFRMNPLNMQGRESKEQRTIFDGGKKVLEQKHLRPKMKGCGCLYYQRPNTQSIFIHCFSGAV